VQAGANPPVAALVAERNDLSQSIHTFGQARRRLGGKGEGAVFGVPGDAEQREAANGALGVAGIARRLRTWTT
jgi:hypothetical protein